jgi:hypothetical protein
MSDREKSTPVDPYTCFFTRTALLTLPPAWRIPMLHVGQLTALGADLRLMGQQLAALGREPESSQMAASERRMCELCEVLAPQVDEASRALLDAGRGIGPDGGRV